MTYHVHQQASPDGEQEIVIVHDDIPDANITIALTKTGIEDAMIRRGAAGLAACRATIANDHDRCVDPMRMPKQRLDQLEEILADIWSLYQTTDHDRCASPISAADFIEAMHPLIERIAATSIGRVEVAIEAAEADAEGDRVDAAYERHVHDQTKGGDPWTGMDADTDDDDEPDQDEDGGDPDYDVHGIGDSVSERNALDDAGRGHLKNW